MRKSTNLRVRRRAQTENWKVQTSGFARISVIELAADAKRRSSFMMYVKESLSVNNSVLIRCLLFTPRFAVSDFYPI